MFSHDPSIAHSDPPKSIIDPYYGGLNGFETCYEQCVDFSDGFLEMLEGGRLDEFEEVAEETEKVARDGRKGKKAGL
jgi:low molecular weight phosphotyrosine protein phosphatase